MEFLGNPLKNGCHFTALISGHGLPWWPSGKESASNDETGVQSLGQEDPLEKEMATHSSILAWRIPWTEEPGGPWAMGSQTVGHDWSD